MRSRFYDPGSRVTAGRLAGWRSHLGTRAGFLVKRSQSFEGPIREGRERWFQKERMQLKELGKLFSLRPCL